MPQVRANGINLEYETFGNPADPALLLIMGLGAQLVLWPEPFCEQLAKGGYHVIRFDNRDVGLSTKIEHARHPKVMHAGFAALFGVTLKVPYTLDDMAQDAVGLLDALQIRKAHIAGASMGGMIAQIIAAKFPERIESLALIMSTSGNPRLPGPSLALRLRLARPVEFADREAQVAYSMEFWRLIGSPGFRQEDDALRAKIERSIDRSSYRKGLERQTLAIIASGSRVPLLKRIRAPTMVIHGADDPLVPVAAAHDLAHHIPGARVEIIKGMGHDLPPALQPRMAELILRNADGARAPGRKRA